MQIPGPADVSAVVTKDGVLTSVEIDEEQYSRAVEEAMSAEKAHGVGSPEAVSMWDIVDEIESSNNSAARMGTLEEECLISASDACERFNDAMEELDKVIKRAGEEA